MPSNVRPERDRARQLYVESGGRTTITAIASALNLPKTTVASWKSRESWDNLLEGAPLDRKGREKLKPHGNALPASIRQSVYEKLKYESFSDDERAILKHVPYDPIVQQRAMIAGYEIQERRIYAHLQRLYAQYEIEREGKEGKEGKGMVVTQEVYSAYLKKDEERPNGANITKVKRTALDMIAVLEELLTKIWRLKQDAINNLHRMETSSVTLEYERRKLLAMEERVALEKERHAVDTSGRDVENLNPIAQMLSPEDHNSGDH